MGLACLGIDVGSVCVKVDVSPGRSRQRRSAGEGGAAIGDEEGGKNVESGERAFERERVRLRREREIMLINPIEER